MTPSTTVFTAVQALIEQNQIPRMYLQETAMTYFYGNEEFVTFALRHQPNAKLPNYNDPTSNLVQECQGLDLRNMSNPEYIRGLYARSALEAANAISRRSEHYPEKLLALAPDEPWTIKNLGGRANIMATTSAFAAALEQKLIATRLIIPSLICLCVYCCLYAASNFDTISTSIASFFDKNRNNSQLT